MEKEKRRKYKSNKFARLTRKYFLPIGIVLLTAGAIVGISFIPIRKISVSGNVYAGDGDIRNYVFREESDHRLGNILFQSIRGIRNDNAFEQIALRLKFFGAEIRVKETEPVFAVQGSGFRYVYNRYGVRVGDYGEDTALPVLEGFPIRDSALFEKPALSPENEKLFKTAVEVFAAVSDRKIPADVLSVSENGILLTFEKVHVNLGKADYLKEKLSEVAAQYEKFKGLQGTLHMEKFDGNNGNSGFYFTVE